MHRCGASRKAPRRGLVGVVGVGFGALMLAACGTSAKAAGVETAQPDRSRQRIGALVRVWRTSERTGWGETAHGLWRTGDGGRRWREVLRFSSPARVVVQTSTQATVAMGDRLERTGDGGRRWSTQALLGGTGAASPIAESLDVLPNSDALVLLSEHAPGSRSSGALVLAPPSGRTRVLATTSGGAGIGRLPSALGRLSFLDADVGLLAAKTSPTSLASLWATTDGGRSWSQAFLPRGMVPLGRPLAFSRAGTWLMAAAVASDAGTGPNCSLLRASRTRPLSWRAVGTCYDVLNADGGLRSPSFLTAREGWEVVGTRLLRTTDAGSSWQVVDPHAVPASLIDHGEQLVEVDFVNASDGWIVLAPSVPSSPAVLLATEDGGRVWHRLSLSA